MSDSSETQLKKSLWNYAVLDILLVAVFALVLLYIKTGTARIAPGLTYDSLKAITLEMSPHEVAAILGSPLDVSTNSVAKTQLLQLPSGNKLETYAPGRLTTYTYAKSRWGSALLPQPALWIHFIDNEVSEVYLKEYWLGDDGVAYSLTPVHVYEHPHLREGRFRGIKPATPKTSQ